MGIGQCIGGVLIVWFAILIGGFYQIREGSVGLIKEFGVLKKELKEPGYHFRIPYSQQVIELSVTLQTEEVTNIPCGTSNGLLVQFDKIEVVNRLDKKLVYKTVLNYTENYSKFWITDKIHHQINQFCSKHTLQQIYIDLFDQLDEELISSLNRDLEVWAPGIKILSVRVTKPSIPKEILKNVENMEKIKIQYMIELEKEKVKIQQKITNQTQRKIKAQSNLAVTKINLDKMIQNKKNDLKMAEIQSEIIFEKQKTKIQTQFLSAFEEASTYPSLFTKEYLSFLAADALTANLTIFVGDKIPNAVFSNNVPTRSSKK